jgi:hypothetical protein
MLLFMVEHDCLFFVFWFFRKQLRSYYQFGRKRCVFFVAFFVVLQKGDIF